MKDILDFVVLALFVFMVAMFIINFNRQQIKKHTDKLEKLEEIEENKNQNKDKNNA